MKSQIENTGNSYGVHHYLIKENSIFLDFLERQYPTLNQNEILELLFLGSIYLNHKRLNHKSLNYERLNCTRISLDGEGQKYVEDKIKINSVRDSDLSDFSLPLLKEGDYLRVHSQARRFPIHDLDWSRRIVYENDDFIVVNKMAGIPVHPTVDNFTENLLVALQAFRKEALYITHRLDIPTSGLIVLAKNALFQKEFNKLLTDRQVKKYYSAFCEGHFCSESNIIRHWMKPSPFAPKELSSEPQETWFECLLEIKNFTLLENMNKPYTLFNILLHTGRTQQIRAQLSKIGHPIVGDGNYGSSEENLSFEEVQACFSSNNNNCRSDKSKKNNAIALQSSEIKFQSFSISLLDDF